MLLQLQLSSRCLQCCSPCVLQAAGRVQLTLESVTPAPATTRTHHTDSEQTFTHNSMAKAKIFLLVKILSKVLKTLCIQKVIVVIVLYLYCMKNIVR